MLVYTKDDLVVRALQRLGEVGDGQSAEPETAKRVRDALDGILDELRADGIYPVPFEDEIPGEAMDALTAIIASRMSDDFGLPQSEIVTLASRAQGAEQKLRRFTAAPVGRDVVAGCYF